MRLLIDMNLSPKWAEFLAAGFEAAHWSALGAAKAPDPEIMMFAMANG
jgi:predicted nuclease of predicted toxin-antitoxin system